METSPPSSESFLVIGGGGTFGRFIVRLLIERGETLVATFDAVEPPPDPELEKAGIVKVFVGDAVQGDDLANAVKDCGATCIIFLGMVHTGITAPSGLAKRTHAQVAAESIQLHKRLQTEGTQNLLRTALACGVTKLVYTSNADIVFEGKDIVGGNETMPYPSKPWASPHASTEMAERMILSFNGINDLKTVAIRPAGLYGAGYATERRLKALQANQFKLGALTNNNPVDHTYSLNAAHAHLLAADRLSPDHPKHSLVAGKAFFISDGEPCPLTDFWGKLWAAATDIPTSPSKEPQIGQTTVIVAASLLDFFSPLKGGELSRKQKCQFVFATRWYDISRARNALDYEPLVSLDEGIRRTAEWWLQKQLKACQDKKATTPQRTLSLHSNSTYSEVSEKNLLL